MAINIQNLQSIARESSASDVRNGRNAGHFNHSTIAKNTLADIQKERNKPQHVLDQDVKTWWRSTCKVLHENQAPVMFYDVRNGRNAGDTYKSNKLNVDEWTEVEEIAGYLQVAADASQMMDRGKYPTSSLVLPCVAKVIGSATKNVVPIAYCGWSRYSSHKLISSNSYAWLCSNAKGSDKTMDF